MALTPGFKKFLGLVATVAVVGGAIVAYNQGMLANIMPQKEAVQEQYVEQERAPEPEPVRERVAEKPQREVYREEARVEHNSRQGEYAPREEAQVQPKHDPSANRGLNALFNATK